MIDFARVAAAALAAAETLVRRWLPGGRLEGREWTCGDLSGSPGRSCKVNLDTGRWSDFAHGDKGGDLVSLYAAVFSMSQAAAARELARELGLIVDESPSPQAGRRSPTPTPAPAPAPAKPRTDWTPIVPVPADAGPAPVAHIARGRPEARWQYRDRGGQLLGVVYRFRTSDGGKEVLPCVYAEHPNGAREWRWLSFPEPRPLYGLDRLQPEGCVLVVEGEKCADAARAEVPSTWSVVSWPGGGKAVDKADWSPLAGRKVIVWPDCDAKRIALTREEKAAGVDPDSKPLKPEREQPGMSAALRIAAALAELHAEVRLVEIPKPGERADGWDVADAIAEGLVGPALRQWIIERLVEVEGRGSPSAVRPSEAPAPESTPAAAGAREDDRAWRSALLRKARGGLEDCRENVMLVLLHHPELAGLVAHNDFAGRTEKLRPAPWGGEAGEWSPRDDRELGLWLATRCDLLIKSETNLAAGVEMAAARASYHPVRDWLRSLTWDGEERLDHWLVACLGAAPTEYVRRVSRLMLLQMVARVMRPGCKADHMAVLEGPQGKGKSSALRILAGPWFSDAPFRVGDKDSFLQLAGVWLYEISEMDAFNRSEVTAVKAFVSQITDRFREPYGRRVIARERQTVLAGTTNQDAYLRDLTGNRRFWPVRVGDKIDGEKLAAWREQLFAEAVRAFDAGEGWWPGRAEEQTLFAPEQERRTIEDPWREILAAWLADPEQAMVVDVTTVELLHKALGVPSERIDSTGQMAKRVVAAMTAIGWMQERVTRPNGSRVRAWMRPAGAPAVESAPSEEVPL